MSSMKLLPNLTKKLGPTRINESCNGLGVVVSLALYAAHFLKQSSLQICNENMRKICNCVSAYISENIPTPFHIMMQDQTSYQMDEMTVREQDILYQKVYKHIVFIHFMVVNFSRHESFHDHFL